MKHLKTIRKLSATLALTAFALLFIRFDSFGWLNTAFHFGQFTPAVLSALLWPAAVGASLILLLTVLSGRLYCSFICPLGIIQDLFIKIRSLLRKKAFRPLPDFTRTHITLAGLMIGAAAAGFMLPISLFEPFATAGRLMAGILHPIATFLFKQKSYLLGDSVGWLGLAEFRPFMWQNFVMVAGTAVFLFFLCCKWGRVYCNLACPVGAILRLTAARSYFKIGLDPEKCVSCGLCANICKAGCIDPLEKNLDFSRCIACGNCLDICKLSGIAIQKRQKNQPEPDTSMSEGRRAFVSGIAATAAAYLLPRTLQASPVTATAILPPGAGDMTRFSSRCISCHLCVAACPSSIIRPAQPQSGLRSLQQPSLQFDHGMCEQNCNLCSQICPVMAIEPVDANDKKLLKIGEVVYKKHLCVVETNGTDCGACAEHCPTQAVRMVPYKNNLMIPETDVSICIGCGSCEHICPVRPERAIIVKPVDKQEFIKLPEQEELSDVGGEEFPF